MTAVSRHLRESRVPDRDSVVRNAFLPRRGRSSSPRTIPDRCWQERLAPPTAGQPTAAPPLAPEARRAPAPQAARRAPAPRAAPDPGSASVLGRVRSGRRGRCRIRRGLRSWSWCWSGRRRWCGLLLPQVLAQREPARADLRGHVPTHVAVVPRLVRVARHGGLALRVRHDEAVLPGVGLQPGTRLGRGPVAVVPGRRPAVAPEVERGPELVLAVPRARTLLDRGRVAVDANPVVERGLLVRVASVCPTARRAGRRPSAPRTPSP